MGAQDSGDDIDKVEVFFSSLLVKTCQIARSVELKKISITLLVRDNCVLCKHRYIFTRNRDTITAKYVGPGIAKIICLNYMWNIREIQFLVFF